MKDLEKLKQKVLSTKKERDDFKSKHMQELKEKGEIEHFSFFGGDYYMNLNEEEVKTYNQLKENCNNAQFEYLEAIKNK